MTLDQKQDLIDYLSGIINEQRCQLLQTVLSQRTRYLTVVLEDIYYPQNASAVIRTCECLGIQELHVIENHHQYRLNPDVVRGASKWIELIRHRQADRNNTRACLERLQGDNYRIVAMMPGQDALELEALPIDDKIAICFGTEESGLSEAVVEMADYRVRIPMNGFTRSFNLSVSAGISLYQLAARVRRSSVDWQLELADAADLYIDWLVKSTPTGDVLMQRYLEQHAAG